MGARGKLTEHASGARARRRRCVSIAIFVFVVLITPPRQGSAAESPGGQVPGAASPTVVLQCEKSAPESASCVIIHLHELLASVTASPNLSFDERCARLAPGVVAAFDLDFMAQKSLGSHGWSISAEDHRRWVAAFTRFTVATYARRLGDSPGRVFEIRDEQPARRDTVLVRGQVVGSGREPIAIGYRMRRADGAWKIVDVYAEGTISQLAVRRAEVASLLDRMSFDEVVEYVDNAAKKP